MFTPFYLFIVCPSLVLAVPYFQQAGPDPNPLQPVFSIQSTQLQSSQSASQPLLMTYYPDWADSSFPPEKIDFGRFDWIDFAFALPDSNFNLTWDDPIGAPSLLSRLVTAAHSKNKYVKLSVGGWTGSK